MGPDKLKSRTEPPDSHVSACVHGNKGHESIRKRTRYYRKSSMVSPSSKSYYLWMIRNTLSIKPPIIYFTKFEDEVSKNVINSSHSETILSSRFLLYKTLNLRYKEEGKGRTWGPAEALTQGNSSIRDSLFLEHPGNCHRQGLLPGSRLAKCRSQRWGLPFPNSDQMLCSHDPERKEKKVNFFKNIDGWFEGRAAGVRQTVWAVMG